MSRIQTTFQTLQAAGRKALIPYVTASFPFTGICDRGDKDISTVADLDGVDFYDQPSMRGHVVKGAK